MSEHLMTEHPYQTLDSRIVWQTPWFKVREDQVLLPDGSPSTYTLIDKVGAVWIVPVLPDGRLVLIRQYRYTVRQWLWEVPAGGIQEGHSQEETARLELAEEIGGTAASLEKIANFFTVPGNSTETGCVFLARDVTLGTPDHEPSEAIHIHALSRGEVQAMIERNEILDAPSLLALLLALRGLEN
jgi:ADP-ribose pyrophosphatase